MCDDMNRGAVEASAAGQEALAEVGLPLDELARRGARDIFQRAIGAEVETLLAEFSEVSLIDGRRAVVRNGHLGARDPDHHRAGRGAGAEGARLHRLGGEVQIRAGGTVSAS